MSIASQWTPGVSSSTVLVGGNCQQVELFANGASRGRINPNAYTNLPHPMFQFTGLTVTSGQLRADCWIGGQIVATDTKFTPGAATHLALVADDSAIRADGADMTRVVVKALDSNNQVVPTNNAAGHVHRRPDPERSWVRARWCSKPGPARSTSRARWVRPER